MEDDNCEYREAKILVYAECDHEMWKFYSCDWFIKSWGSGAVQYDTLNALLAANKSYATWDGTSGRGSRIGKLLYAKTSTSISSFVPLRKRSSRNEIGFRTAILTSAYVLTPHCGSTTRF